MMYLCLGRVDVLALVLASIHRRKTGGRDGHDEHCRSVVDDLETRWEMAGDGDWQKEYPHLDAGSSWLRRRMRRRRRQERHQTNTRQNPSLLLRLLLLLVAVVVAMMVVAMVDQ